MILHAERGVKWTAMDDNRTARSNRSTSTPTTSQSSSGRTPARSIGNPAHVHPAKPPCRIHVRHLQCMVTASSISAESDAVRYHSRRLPETAENERTERPCSAAFRQAFHSLSLAPCMAFAPRAGRRGRRPLPRPTPHTHGRARRPRRAAPTGTPTGTRAVRASAVLHTEGPVSAPRAEGGAGTSRARPSSNGDRPRHLPNGSPNGTGPITAHGTSSRCGESSRPAP